MGDWNKGSVEINRTMDDHSRYVKYNSMDIGTILFHENRWTFSPGDFVRIPWEVLEAIVEWKQEFLGKKKPPTYLIYVDFNFTRHICLYGGNTLCGNTIRRGFETDGDVFTTECKQCREALERIPNPQFLD